MPSFVYSSWIPAPVGEVFAFHERPDALDRLMPPWSKARILERTGGLEVGAKVRLRIPVGPFGMEWLAVHTGYRKNRYFEDIQQRGPFRVWRHRHEFAEEDEGTRLTDRIEFSLPLAPVADWLAAWFVRIQLRLMFAYRHGATANAVAGRGGIRV